MEALDSPDRKILYELDIDSRQTDSAIAKKLNMDETEVSSRIKELVDSGVILGFNPIINVYKLGYSPYRLSVRLKDISRKERFELFEVLNSREDIGWLVSCRGRWDLSAVVWAKDTHEFQEFLSEFLQEYGKHVEKKKVAVVHRLYVYSRACLLGDEAAQTAKKSEIISEGKPIELSEEDWSLLRLLAINSRMDTQALARILKKPPSKIDSLLNSLMKEEVLHGFRLSPNYSLLGIKYHKVYLRLSGQTKASRKKLLDHIRKNPYVVYIDEAFGGGDVELEFQVNKEETFLKQLAEIREKFGNLIRDQEVVTFQQEYKFQFLPPRPSNQ
ncbi:AsnC family transcriptional regulator [Candidatus Micrarchaeota archaeon]|nr:AsnC family transcriptional regulator [Candidatus Micrarchaeota archaeon]MBD3418228.1 AsnC family transcriptional regulator [Candidatus Micrarchaeota archaeon]